jgi:RNA polymerase sigma-70 factor (ECF subfamily)
MSPQAAQPPADPSDLGIVYRDAFGMLVGYLEGITGDRPLAEDVAQDAGIKLFEFARQSSDPIRNPRALLFHIASNLARDQLRRRQVRGRIEHLDENMVSQTPGAEQKLDLSQQLDRVSAAVERLPARRRAVLLLSRVEGLSHREIGERLGIAAKTVENQLARALAQLAQDLQR